MAYIIKNERTFASKRTGLPVPMVTYYCAGNQVIQLCGSPADAKLYDFLAHARRDFRRLFKYRTGYSIIPFTPNTTDDVQTNQEGA